MALYQAKAAGRNCVRGFADTIAHSHTHILPHAAA
jgi:hypothetical protein